uniref:Similar to Os11g0123400 n=1 Tax=Arundo donax TaxID=35708 RepID=A0A0A9EHW9_ARUDO
MLSGGGSGAAAAPCACTWMAALT